MGETTLNPEQLATLAALANGIIPADEMDAGAAAVEAGPKLAAKIQMGTNAGLYRSGLDLAQTLAHQTFGRAASQLPPSEIHDLLSLLRAQLPVFFKQLRMDVSALYLSDPAV